MIRRKHVFFTAVLLVMMASLCWAETWDFNLNAGGNTLTTGLHYKTYLDTGYMRIGGSGVWVDENETEFKWGSVDFMVGSDTLRPGLNVELGLRSILGTADEGAYSGDMGAIGFSGMANYLFPTNMLPIPFEIFCGVTWAPELLSFMDTETYTEYTIGAGVRIIKNASIILSYTNYRAEMESGSSPWVLNHDNMMIGLAMRF